jgi:hypothetical protein
MKETLADNISELITNIKTYVNAKIDLNILLTFEKIGKLQSFLLSTIILMIILSFCVFFITIALAISIGNSLNNHSLGFFIIGGAYLIVAIIFYLFRKQLIEKTIIKNLIKILFPLDKNND